VPIRTPSQTGLGDTEPCLELLGGILLSSAATSKLPPFARRSQPRSTPHGDTSLRLPRTAMKRAYTVIGYFTPCEHRKSGPRATHGSKRYARRDNSRIWPPPHNTPANRITIPLYVQPHGTFTPNQDSLVSRYNTCGMTPERPFTLVPSRH